MRSRFFRRRSTRCLALFGLAIIGLLTMGPRQVAQAQTVTTCHAAAAKGADGPLDYGAYCWIDFTSLNLTQAKSGAGQDFRVNLQGGAYLTFTLKIAPLTAAGANMYAVPVPSWTGAAFGNSAFNSIPGNPILYQDQNNQNGPQDTITLSNLVLNANGTTDLPFVFVAADGESSNAGETLTFTTTGDTWNLVDAPGISDLNRNMPDLTPPTMVGGNTGSQTVTEAGTDAGPDGEGSYVFTTNNSPGTVTATLVGSGLQGVLFGLKYHTIGLSLTKTHTGDFKVGGTGSYVINVANTVVAPTVNPPSEPQPVEVVDTLPTGLTYASAGGSGWTCSNVGQVITCDTTSLQDLTTSRTFSPITVNVNIANDAPATLTNNATVTDPTTSTLVFNVCVTADNVVCPNSATSTDGDDTTIIHSNLSTSTKTVVDKNGGDAEPGDVLEYTVTLTESAGIPASNVSVADDMPANVGNLTMVSPSPLPAGWINNSTITGGANGTGQLDISGINLPANGSATIVYDVTIAAGTADGVTIDNTATINNPNGGTGATPAAPTITVAQSQVPTSGKVLYVYTSNDALTRTPQTAPGGGITIGQGNSHDWVLTPALAKDLTLAGGSTVSVSLLVKCVDIRNGACQSGNRLQWTAALYDGASPIGSASGDATFNYTNYTPVTADISISAATPVLAGHQLTLRITNTSSRNRNMQVEQYDADNRSTVTLAQSTVINVDSVQTYANADCTGGPVTSAYQAGSTVYLCAVVSDPFGSADVDPASGGTAPSIAIADADGTPQVMANMNQVADSGAATKTFEYTYTVPTAPVLGNWTAKVTAWEGTEHTVNRSGSGTFAIQAPHPSLIASTKTVVDLNGGDAKPNDVLEYTITLNESAGEAVSGVHVVDDMPLHVGSLTVISNAGGTDSSSTTGGSNGTGKLDINGISVPANGSKTIVYDVTIASDAVPGTTIDNTATITGVNASGATPAAPTITVSLSQLPASGNKLLYVYENGSLTRTPQTGGGSGAVSIADGGSATWTLTSALAKELTIKANSTISINLLVACVDIRNGTCRNGNGLHWTAALYDNAVSAATQIGSTSPNASFNDTGYTLETANIAVGGSDVAVAAGHQLILQVANANSSNHPMRVEQYDAGNRSTASLDVSTVVNVDSVGIYSDVTCATPITPSPVYETNSTIYVCAVISDPFGSSDIDPSPGGTAPTLTITDADGINHLDAASMTQRASDAATKTFSYTYIVPASPPATLALGGWTAAVTAWEGTEHTVSHTSNGSFDVEAPDLVMVKSVSVVSDPVEGATNPKALPGARIRYNIVITNQGKGPVDDHQLIVTDPIPTHTNFVIGSITSSGTGSGVSDLTSGDISYSDNNGSTWSYTPTDSGDGTDPNVTNIRFSPQGRMSGKTDTTTPTYTITFDVTIQ